MQKALKCKTADGLLNLAEAEGYEMTKAEAEAYLAEIYHFANGVAYLFMPFGREQLD